MTNRELQVILSLRDEATQRLNQFNNSLGNITKTIRTQYINIRRAFLDVARATEAGWTAMKKYAESVGDAELMASMAGVEAATKKISDEFVGMFANSEAVRGALKSLPKFFSDVDKTVKALTVTLGIGGAKMMLLSASLWNVATLGLNKQVKADIARFKSEIKMLEEAATELMIANSAVDLGRMEIVDKQQAQQRQAVKSFIEFTKANTHAAQMFFREAAESFKTFFLDAFNGQLTTARDYFAAFGKSLVTIAADIAGQIAAYFLILRPLVAMFPGVAPAFGMAAPIKGAAAGGIARTSGAVMVGERGPEVLRVPRGAVIEPLTSAGGGTNITINYTSAGGGSEQDARKIAAVIASSLRKNGAVRTAVRRYG